MKGLLRKDAYMLWKVGKPFFLICIVFLAVLVYAESNLTFALFPCLMAGILPVTLISYEERDKWQSYSALLPVSRAQLVSEKYIFTLLLLCGWFALLAVVFIVRSIWLHVPLSDSPIQTFLLFAAFGLCLPAVLLPAVFKLGTEKARIFYIVILCIFGALFGFIGARTNAGDFIFTAPLNFGAPVFFGVLVLFAASWALSVRLFQKRNL